MKISKVWIHRIGEGGAEMMKSFFATEKKRFYDGSRAVDDDDESM